MQATITKQFRIAPEGHTVVIYDVGAIVKGQTAEIAVEAGYASPLDAPEIETKPAPVLEKKPARKRKNARGSK